MDALEEAIKIVGGVTKLATLIQVRPNVVGNWRIRKSVPPKYATRIESATNGAVKCHQIAPEVFPTP